MMSFVKVFHRVSVGLIGLRLRVAWFINVRFLQGLLSRALEAGLSSCVDQGWFLVLGSGHRIYFDPCTAPLL